MSSLRGDPGALRRLLASAGGRPSWRALEQVADSPEFGGYIQQAHPSLGPMLAGPSRRRVLQVMAASLALGGLTGCDKRLPSSGTNRIVPYVNQPTGLTPSEPLDYASATLLDGIANGMLVTTVNGRPIKIEGNPQHPFSRGGTDVFSQASVLGLYDPDRSQAVQHLGTPSDWDTLQASMLNRFAAARAQHGTGLRLLTGPISSPTLLDQITRLKQALPDMHWHVLAPVGRDTIYAGAQQVFGKPLETQWHFDKAQLSVSLDGDFLDSGPHQIAASRAWVEARRSFATQGKLLPLHAVAPVPTLTYAKADYHAPVAQRDLLPLAQALLADISTGQGGQTATPPPATQAAIKGPAAAWGAQAAAELKAAHGASLVVTGAHQSPELHAVVHQINAALGNVGKTVTYTDPVLGQAEPFADLVTAMQAGDVTTLIMLDANPVYAAPGDAQFGTLLQKVTLKLHAGLHVDETGARSDWHLPLSHPLESWADARSLDGTATMIQPTIERLYDTRTVSEILSILFDPQPRSAFSLMRDYWQKQMQGADFETNWRQALQAGFVDNTAFSQQTPTANPAPVMAAAPAPVTPEILIRPDPTVWDGSLANNAWLQELPKPMLKTVWENVVTVSPAFAGQHKLKNDDFVTIELGRDALSGQVWVLPGQNDDTVMVQLGYGRASVGSVGNGLGYNAYALRRLASPWQAHAAKFTRGHGSRVVPTTQQLDTQEGHDYVRLQEIGAKPVGDTAAFTQPTFYDRDKTDGRAWGMVIDLDACIGCNACVVACQAENNVPVVGREQILAGRDMHWLRVDRYYAEEAENPDVRFMPVPCMHCETAPCELGCPVEATVHDKEGLNLMVYNRCVGTRACSAYCPYKVRHFNFLHYSEAPAVEQLQRNPSVTVRARGVMEKCTYCVQRIVKGRINADKEDRPIRDGEVVTACASACPTQAIFFGDLADKGSAVAKARQDGRNYALLGELNTRPRTTYLAALTPNKEKA
ncbi:MAG TPA: Fe-S cluster-containing hydrogenase [Rhodopila sp.]|nr:Fe-S cluster-containing hydrogenase [Rhodopila sp.]